MDPSPRPSRVVLASASPRRRRLLEWLDMPFDVTSVDTPENLDSPLADNPAALATHLACEKFGTAIQTEPCREALTLCFDTIVVLDGKILGKPVDGADARHMLRALSGRTHQVVTGCAFGCSADSVRSFAITTDVRMHDLSDDDIESWMSSGEYMGCAGAYNIEGQVAAVTDSDCYQNVAGLPLCHLYAALLGRLPGLAVPTCLENEPRSPWATCDHALGRSCRRAPQVLGPSPR